MEGSVPVSASSSPVRPDRKPLAADEEAMELLWQDGHLVVQRHPPHVGYGDTPAGQPPAGGVEDQTPNYGPLFVREDEIDSWLHYDEPFYGIDFWRFQDGEPSESSSATGESMLVDCVHAALVGSPSFVGYGGGGGSTGAAKSEMMMTPAPEPPPPPPLQRQRSADGRKRKGGAEPGEAECDSEDAKFGATNAKKPRCRTPVPPRRSRSSEVHNRSERKRRDRINGKIRALQELIPRSTKAADKVSTLDCAIEYLKTLQQQLQMMSMGRGMVLMTYPSMSAGVSVGDPMRMFGNNMVPSAVPCPPFLTSSPSAAALPSVQSHPTTYLQPLFAPMGMQGPPVQQQPLHPNFAYPYQHYPRLLQTHYSQ